MARRQRAAGVIAGRILEEEAELSLAELCRAAGTHAEWIAALVEEGVLEPRGRGMGRWRFSATSLRRVQVVRRLQQDLDVNLSGAALALELMEEIRALRARLIALQRAADEREGTA